MCYSNRLQMVVSTKVFVGRLESVVVGPHSLHAKHIYVYLHVSSSVQLQIEYFIISEACLVTKSYGTKFKNQTACEKGFLYVAHWACALGTSVQAKVGENERAETCALRMSVQGKCVGQCTWSQSVRAWQAWKISVLGLTATRTNSVQCTQNKPVLAACALEG